MKDYELIDVFLQAQEPDYFHYRLVAIGKPFAEAIKIGEMVDIGIKSGMIVSQAAIRSTTQAIQSGSANFTNRKKQGGRVHDGIWIKRCLNRHEKSLWSSPTRTI